MFHSISAKVFTQLLSSHAQCQPSRSYMQDGPYLQLLNSQRCHTQSPVVLANIVVHRSLAPEDSIFFEELKNNKSYNKFHYGYNSPEAPPRKPSTYLANAFTHTVVAALPKKARCYAEPGGKQQQKDRTWMCSLAR